MQGSGIDAANDGTNEIADSGNHEPWPYPTVFASHRAASWKENRIDGMWISIVISVIGAVTGIAGVCQAHKANKTAGKALKASEDRLEYEWRRVYRRGDRAICMQNNSPNTALNVFVAAQSDKAAGNLCVAQQASVAPYDCILLEGLDETDIVKQARNILGGLPLRFQVRWESENGTLRSCSVEFNVY